MKTRRNCISGLGWMVLVLSLAGAGCVNVSAPKSIKIGGGGDKKKSSNEKYEDERKITKDEAYTIAKDKAINKGADVHHYDIRDKEVDGHYWMVFESKNPEGNSWKDHFIVRVSMFGWSTFYKKPAKRYDEWKGRRADKGRAYDIAKKIASTEGIDPKQYEVHDKEIEGLYWVIFETKHYHKAAGWKNHFAVRVSRDCEVELYR